MMAQNGTLSAKQRRVLAHLAAGETIVATAERTGASRRQIHRWLDDAAFADALADAQRSIFQRAMHGLQARAEEAGAELVLLLKHDDPRIRLRASKVILDAGRRWDVENDQHERMRRIEEAIERLKEEQEGRMHAV